MSGSSPEPWAFLPNLYRFATVLTSDPELAGRLVSAAIGQAVKNGDLADASQVAASLYAEVRGQCLRTPLPEPRSGTLPEGAARVLHRFEEPGRSALTMLYLGDLDARAICHALDLNAIELGDALTSAREHLASGPSEPAPAPVQPHE